MGKAPGDRGQKKKAAAILAGSETTWYQCEHCEGRIYDRHKARCVNAGYWGSQDRAFKFYVDGRVEGTLPAGNEVGIYLWTIYSLAAKHSFRGIAAEWIKCDGDPARTQNFVNSWRGENFETQISKTTESEVVNRKVNAPPPLVVPAWAGALLATADTQKDYFYWVIRAWGYGYRSQLVACGTARTFEELYQVTLESRFEIGMKDEGGRMKVSAQALLIDSGGWKGAESGMSRTREVYAFAARDPLRIFPTKGSSTAMMRPIAQPTAIVGFPGVQLMRFDPGYFEDRADAAHAG